MGKLTMMFSGIYDFIATTDFTIDGVTFTLLDVFWGGVCLSIIGFGIGKIILFTEGDR